MERSALHKPSQEQARPTPTQERAVTEGLWRCRTLSTTAVVQRITAYHRL
jgi:hypothetical protein